MSKLIPIKRNEVGRFTLLAALFFINTLVLESNEVVATSGFVREAGVSRLLIVWTVVMASVLLSSSAYSLVVDRIDRERFSIVLFFILGLLYLGFYFLFSTNVPQQISFGLLAVLTEQHWITMPLLLYAVANDIFDVTEAKRIFPVLTIPTILGSITGNSVAAAIGQFFGDATYQLLLVNSMLILIGGLILILTLPNLELYEHSKSNNADRLRDIWQEGVGFIRDVPSFRYLTIAMLLLGICLNTIEFRFLADVAMLANEPGQLATFYGVFKIVTAVGLLILAQSGLVSTLLNKLGFKNIFMVLPGSMTLGLMLSLVWIFPLSGTILITGSIMAAFTTRLTLTGVDEPSRRAFQGLVPDQRRGRVSAFMDGYLYPLGSILGCAVLGVIEILAFLDVITRPTSRWVSLIIALVCAVSALWAIFKYRENYDKSMLNWRLKRRSRGRSILNELEF